MRKDITLPDPPTSGGLRGHAPKAVLNSLLDSIFCKEQDFRTALSERAVDSWKVFAAFTQSIVSLVRELCEKLAFVEPSSITRAVQSLQQLQKSIFHMDTSNPSLSVSGVL